MSSSHDKNKAEGILIVRSDGTYSVVQNDKAEIENKTFFKLIRPNNAFIYDADGETFVE